MYLVELTYIKPIEEIDKQLKPHIEFLKKYTSTGKIIMAGRKLPRTGGMLIINSKTRNELDEILSEDPFMIHDLASFNIQEFVPSIIIDELQHLRQS